jgi:hypothetical protein
MKLLDLFKFKSFKNDESGAVTVDMNAVAPGITTLAGKISTSVGATTMGTTP